MQIQDWFCSGELPLQGLFQDEPPPWFLSNIDPVSYLEPKSKSTWDQIEMIAKAIPKLFLSHFQLDKRPFICF